MSYFFNMYDYNKKENCEYILCDDKNITSDCVKQSLCINKKLYEDLINTKNKLDEYGRYEDINKEYNYEILKSLNYIFGIIIIIYYIKNI